MYAGGTGLYQGAQLANLHNGEEVTEGLALEQLPPMTFTQLKSEAKSTEWTSEARLKRERIMAMNLVLGIPVSQKEFDSSLRVIYTMESGKKGTEKKEKAVIKDVIAPAITTAFIDAGSSEITAGDKALIKKLSSGAKELIKKLDVDADRIKNWGLIPSDKVDLLMARITQLKKMVK